MYELRKLQEITEPESFLSDCMVIPDKRESEAYDRIVFETNALLEYQVLDAGWEDYTEQKGQTVSQKQDKTADAADEKKSILDWFFETRTEDALEQWLKEDRNYQKINAEARREIEKIEKIKLSREQWLIVDNALSACNKRSSRYGQMAYKQGFWDAMHLLKELCQLI